MKKVNIISKKFKVNGKATIGKENKTEALERLGLVTTVKSQKTWHMVNGVPTSIKTGKPMVKQS